MKYHSSRCCSARGDPCSKRTEKDCEGRPYAKICKRQLLLFLRGATLRLYCKGRPYADVARGDPTLILQEATPAAVVLTILLILSLFFFSSEPCRKTLFRDSLTKVTTGGVETSGSGPENLKDFTSFDANLAQDERDCVFGAAPRRNIVRVIVVSTQNKKSAP